jgi:hypothetical protein
MTAAVAVRAASADEIGAQVGSDDRWDRPINILTPMVAPPLSVDDVPAVIGNYASLFARAAGFDPTPATLAGVVATAAVVDDGIRVLLPGVSSHFESARLWAGTIAGSGAGKSPSYRPMQAPVFALHRDLIEQAERERASSGADAQDKVPRRALFTSDCTIDKLSEVLAANPRGILYTVDELDSWLGSHDAFSRDGGSRSRGEWMRLFDGGPHQVDRVGRGSYFVPNWGASMLTATTPTALQRHARRLPADGLFQRFLVFTARRMQAADSSILRAEVTTAEDRYNARLRALFHHSAALVDPPVVRLSSEASELYESERMRLLELTEAAENMSEGFAAHVAKHPGMLARVALTFHAASDELLDGAGVPRHPCSRPISGETMRCASRFMHKAYRHAYVVYGALFNDDAPMALAHAIARVLLAERLQDFNRRELTHKCNAWRKAPEWQRFGALRALDDYCWIEGDTLVPEHGGRWLVNPRVHVMFMEEAAAARARRELVREALTGSRE